MLLASQAHHHNHWAGVSTALIVWLQIKIEIPAVTGLGERGALIISTQGI